MPIFDSKPAWASKTYWGWLIMVVSYFFSGIDLEALRQFGGETLETGVFLIGAALVAVGRALANAKIKLWPSSDGT